MDCHFNATRFAFEFELVQFCTGSPGDPAHDLSLRTTDLLLIKVADMPITTLHTEDMARLLRWRWWERFPRLGINYLLRLLAHSQHEIIVRKVFQQGKHAFALLTSLEHRSSSIDRLFPQVDTLVSGLLEKH